MPKPVPGVLRSTAARFYNGYRDRLAMFEEKCEVAPGVVVRLTGGHTPGHSVVELTSGGDRLMFALTPCSRSRSTVPTGTTALNMTVRSRLVFAFVFIRELVESRGLLVAAFDIRLGNRNGKPTPIGSSPPSDAPGVRFNPLGDFVTQRATPTPIVRAADRC